MKQKRHVTGFSLLNILFALVVVAIIITAILKLYSVVSFNNKIRQTVEQVKRIEQAAFQYQQMHGFSTSETSPMSISDLIDLHLITLSDQTNAFNGSNKLKYLPNARAESTFVLSMENISNKRHACDRLKDILGAHLTGGTNAIICSTNLTTIYF